MSFYNRKKILKHFDRLVKLRSGEIVAPIHVRLHLYSGCNFSCDFCNYETKAQKTLISYEKACEILKNCVSMGVKAITFSGGGEPTLHSDFGRIAIRARELGLETALITNGSQVLDKSVIESFSWIRVSLDAGSPLTFSRLKGVKPDVFTKVLKNLEVFLNYSRRPVVGVSYLITEENHFEIEDFVCIMKRVGVDNIRFGALHRINYKEFFVQNIGARIEALKAKESPIIYNVFSKIVNEGKPSYKKCWYIHLAAQICSNLDVYTCCLNIGNKKHLLGSLEGCSFEELWFSKQRQDLLMYLDASDCSECYFNERNVLLNDVLSLSQHDNFV